MNWLLSLGLAVLTAGVGGFGSVVLADRCVRWYRISSVEGASSYFVAGIGLLGLVLGFFIGLITARVIAASPEPTFLRALGWSIGLVLAATGVATVFARLRADVPPTLRGRPLVLQVEIRGAEGAPKPERACPNPPYAQVQTFGRRSQPAGWLQTEHVHSIDGYWTVMADVPLVTSAAHKLLRLHLGTDADVYFPLALPPRPRAPHLEWSDWVSPVADMPQPANTAAYQVRYRVKVVPAPPPPPTAAEAAANREAREVAEFRALDPAAPLRVWLPSTEAWVRADLRQEALRVVQQRPRLALELKSLLLGPDAEHAAEAARLIPALENTEPLVPIVQAAGRDLARRLGEVIATPAEKDPGYDGAMRIALRFSGWIDAARVLRERHGADFSPQLQEILSLARQRPDSHALSADVVRVASYYLQQWAGVAPLPSDPPPR